MTNYETLIDADLLHTKLLKTIDKKSDHICQPTNDQATSDTAPRVNDNADAMILTGQAQVFNTATAEFEPVYVVLDMEADRSFISNELAARLQLKDNVLPSGLQLIPSKLGYLVAWRTSNDYGNDDNVVATTFCTFRASTDDDSLQSWKDFCIFGTLPKDLLQRGGKIRYLAANKVDQFDQFEPATISSSDALERMETLEKLVKEHHEKVNSTLNGIQEITSEIQQITHMLKLITEKMVLIDGKMQKTETSS
ncbi:unnamed protein product [Heligmosomoides polygyrus]|uniref:DUF1758 domain-containing protein n=1 Tax=Heligmosomoides polygyrus TaxID=6339 RepID=A0A183F690_HELPZ|nr:unnamed protein product [Heligmosomoides polygyrus]